MDVKEIQIKHFNSFKALKKRGKRNRQKLLILLIPGAYIAYYIFNLNYYRFNWYEYMPYNRVIILTFIVLLGLLAIIFSVSPYAFVNSKLVRKAKITFKKDIYKYVKFNNPEVDDYLFKQKIHPKVFKSSNLFNNNFADYKGDDWFKGKFHGVGFELCELHVSRMFKKLFDGIFIRCRINKGCFENSSQDNSTRYKALIDKFQQQYNTEVKISFVGNNMFLTINRDEKLFENDTLKAIEKIEYDINLLNNSILFIKYLIEETCTNFK